MLYKQELRKMFLRDGFLVLFLVCITVMLFLPLFQTFSKNYGDSFAPSAYRQMSSKVQEMSGEEQVAFFSQESEVYDFVKETIKDEWKDIQNYDKYIEQIMDGGVNGLKGMSESDYQTRLREQYRKKYNHLNGISLSFVGGRGIELFLQTDSIDYCLILFVILLTFRLIVWEIESGMECINLSTQKGRGKLLQTKWLVGLFVLIFVYFIVYLDKLLVYTTAYGFQLWGSPVQVISGYIGVSSSFSVFQFVIVFICSKLLGFLHLYTVMFCLAVIGKNVRNVITLDAIFILISAFMLYGISGVSDLWLLSYFSPLQCINQQWVLSGYHALKIFEYPVDYLFLHYIIWAVSLILMFLFLSRQTIQSRERKSIFQNKGILYRQYKAKKVQSILFWEGRKGFIFQGGMYICLFVMACVLILYPTPKEYISDADEYYYRQVMNEIQGKFTGDKKAYVEGKIAKLKELEKDVEENGASYTASAMQVATSELAKMNVLEKVEGYLEYLENEQATHILYPKGYQLLLGKNVAGGYLRFCNMLAIIIMVFLSVSLWGEDQWNQMDMLCKSSAKGKHFLNKRKYLLIVIYGMLVGIIVYIPWIFKCCQGYSMKFMMASANSLEIFQGIGSISIGAMIGLGYLFRVLYLIFLGMGAKQMQRYLKEKSITVYGVIILGLLPLLFVM